MATCAKELDGHAADEQQDDADADQEAPSSFDCATTTPAVESINFNPRLKAGRINRAAV